MRKTTRLQKYLPFVLLIFCAGPLAAQEADDDWSKWDSKYPKTDILSMLARERHYADSVEHSDEPPTYGRSGAYRFEATYLAKERKIDSKVDRAMRMSYKLFVGNPSDLDTLVVSEALFQVGNEKIWMPIQKQVLQSLKEESHEKSQVLLYCLFLNWHNMTNELFNTFLISEFQVISDE